MVDRMKADNIASTAVGKVIPRFVFCEASLLYLVGSGEIQVIEENVVQLFGAGYHRHIVVFLGGVGTTIFFNIRIISPTSSSSSIHWN